MGVEQVIKTRHDFRVFEDRERLMSAASEYILTLLKKRLSQSDHAFMALSGGSTPKPVYEHLSHSEFTWDQVFATLVDDRVTDDPQGSNAKMVEDIFVQKEASKLNFKVLDAANDALFGETFLQPIIDIAVMGMGTDGHTASWFPGSSDLRAAMDLETSSDVMNIRADGCPGAGIYPNRVTMTLPLIMRSRNIILLITGDEKRRVFDESFNKSVYDAPVKALLAAGPRLTVMWAP